MDSQKHSRFKKIILGTLAAAAGLFVISTAGYWVKQADYVVNEVVAAGVAAREVPPGEKSAPDRLMIARLKVEAPIVYVDEADEKIFQQALQSGVVHYPG